MHLKQRLLLVDDDPLLLAAMVRSLRNVPVEVRTAGSVRDAIAVIAEWPPDAIVSDVDLGQGQNGFDLVSLLMFSGTPIALASGYVTESRNAHAAALSAPLYEKPVDIRTVVEQLLSAGKGAEG